MCSEETSQVIFELNDGIARITINNPKKRNALNLNIANTMIKYLDKCSDDPNVKVILLQGIDNNFCGGGDVKNMKEKNDLGVSDTRQSTRIYANLIRSVVNNEKIVVSKLEGAVAGGGLSLALASDFLYTTNNCIFVFAFINIGFIPDMGSTKLILQNIGITKAKELMMLGQKFSGLKAKEYNLVTNVYSEDTIDMEVEKILKIIKNGPTQAYSRLKKLLNNNAYHGLSEAIESESDFQYELCKSDNHKEAVNAFFEKRKPNFK